MKSKIFIAVIFVLGLLGTTHAQIIRSFEDMGYDDATIRGIQGSLTYFLKIKPDDDVNNSKLILHIKASQVLNQRNSF
jgi:uncharacterized iron-regulated protein